MKYYENFLGFRFGEHHSRDLGLYRVSDGDRYNDVSIPAFSDTTSKIPGGDGTYYWDSFYNQRTFTINTAFDSLSESQLRQIRQIFNGKVEDWLIFDEVPYKKYRVKVQSPPQIKYHSFREDPVYDAQWNRTFERPRVYKGEIVFQFVSYYPYGIDNFKTVPFMPKVATASTSIGVHKGGTFTGRLTVRDPYGKTITLPAAESATSNSVCIEDSNRLPTNRGQTVYIPNLKVYAKDSSGDYYEYFFGSTNGYRASVTKLNNDNFQIDASNTYWFGSATTSINYYSRSDKWDYVRYDENKYNKDPSHYYYHSGAIYVPAAGPQWSTLNEEYCVWVPDLREDEYLSNSYKNASEWYDSVQLLSDTRQAAFEVAGSMDENNGAGYFIYNPGDLPTDVKININSAALPTNTGLKIVLKHRVQGASNSYGDDIILSQLNFNNFSALSGDSKIVIDTARNLVYGVKSNGTQSGNLYNRYIANGEFFKLPVTQKPDVALSSALVDYCDYIWINVPRPSNGSQDCSLEYNYLYY